MSSDTIHVAIAIDGTVETNWFMLICLDSIRRTTNSHICVHFFLDPKNTSRAHLELAYRLLDRSDNEYKIYDVSEQVANLLGGRDGRWAHVTPIAMSKLVMPDVIPVDKFIYTDVDTVFVRDIRTLWLEDLHKCNYGMVQAYYFPGVTKTHPLYPKMLERKKQVGYGGLSPDKKIFATGLIVFDKRPLDVQPSLSSIAPSVINELPGNLLHDQSLINLAIQRGELYDKVHELDPKYIVCASHTVFQNKAQRDDSKRRENVDFLDIDLINSFHGTNYRSCGHLYQDEAVIYHYFGRYKKYMFHTSKNLRDKYYLAVGYASGE